MFFLLLVIGLAMGVWGESSDEQEDTPSKLTSGFLKSRSAARDMSYSSSFGSEDFDSPDIPSDFHARYGINKTWYVRTPHPILSRRASFEEYGQPRILDSTDEDSSETEASSKSEENHKKLKALTEKPSATIKRNTILNMQSRTEPLNSKYKLMTTKSQTSAKQSLVPSPVPSQKKTLAATAKFTAKETLESVKSNDISTIATQNIKPNHLPETGSTNSKLQSKTPSEKTNLGTKLEEKLLGGKAPTHRLKTSSRVTLPVVIPAVTKGREIGQSKAHLESSPLIKTDTSFISTHESTQTTEKGRQPINLLTSKEHLVDAPTVASSHHHDTRQPSSIERVHTYTPIHSTAHMEFMDQHQKLSTRAGTELKTRTWGPALPKMDRSRKRNENVIVLKPPPEDWPEPKIPEGAKPFPPAPEFGAKVPASEIHINPRLDRKGKAFSSSSYASPPYMGHRKIDLVPQHDRTVVAGGELAPLTPEPSAKWRIKGRRDRQGLRFRGQKGGGYLNEIGRDPGFRRDLTVKPIVSQFFIPENATYLIPTVRNTRSFQRSYVNFRMRPPVNIGRSHGPPAPPFPQPPPPHFAPHPYGQPHYPQFHQGPFPPFGPPPPPFGPYGPPPPPPPFGQAPPPPPPPFGQGLSPHFRRGPPPPKFSPDIPSAPPPEMAFHQVPLPRGPPDPFPAGPPPPPPSPYPTGPNLPPPRPFLENIPTINPIDGVPAPWPRRNIQTEFRAPLPRVPEFLKQEPRNFSGYKGPRRGRAYEQYGKADLRPRQVKFFGDFNIRGTPPRFPLRKGSGFGMEFQDDITRAAFVPGAMFARRTWPTRVNRFGYEPYRRSSDRRRPYGYGQYAAARPPVLGEFGEYKPYKRFDNEHYIPFNYSRPTRSYTFPPRLRLAIKNASYYRKTFRRSQYRGYTLPTLPSIGLEAYMAHAEDYYGNPVTPKGRIMNLQDLKNFFTPAPETEGVADVTEAAAPQKMVPKITSKPKGMTAREAMRAAAREAIRETEMEAWEQGEGVRRRRGGRRVGGGAGPYVRRGGARGTGQRNFRRAKRSVEEDAAWMEKRTMLKQELYDSGDYLTGPGAQSSSSAASAGGSRRRPRSKAEPPLRMRRFLLRRGKGRPLRHG